MANLRGSFEALFRPIAGTAWSSRACLRPKGELPQEAVQGEAQVVLRKCSNREGNWSVFSSRLHKAKPGPEGPGFAMSALRQAAPRKRIRSLEPSAHGPT